MSIVASVVIPTYKRTEWLMDLLESLSRQTLPFHLFEVIVVDDASPNGEEKSRRVHSIQWPFAFTYLVQAHSGPAAARNKGISISKGKIVVFTDDDALAESQWLQEIIPALDEDKVGGVAGITRSLKIETLTERYLDFADHLREHHYGESGELVYLITVNAAFPKKVLELVGGFDEKFPFPSGEDMDLGFRIRRQGYRFVRNDKAIVTHRQRTSVPSMWKTWFIYGRGALMCARKNPEELAGGVTSGKLWEPLKVLETMLSVPKKMFQRGPGNLEVTIAERAVFTALELSNHVAYQVGRLYERALGKT